MALDDGGEAGKVPRSRLNQIAERKLTALTLVTKLRGDGETLEGELLFKTPVPHPAKGPVISKALFTVVGHDRLQFSDAPLSALGPVPFFDVESLPALELRVATLLKDRMAQLQRVSERMRALQMEVGFEPDRLLVRGMVRSKGFLFELLGAPDAVRVWRVTPAGGKTWDVPRSVPPLNLDAYQGSVDLEIHLTSSVHRWEQARSEEKTSAAGASPTLKLGLTALPSREGLLTVSALRRFGDGVMVSLAGGKLELSQEFEVDGVRHRFAAVCEAGTTFQGRIVSAKGEVWSDRFELSRFPGITALMSAHFKMPLTGAAPAPGAATKPTHAPTAGTQPLAPTAAAPIVPPAAEPPPSSSIPDYLQPHAGEVWVMHVLIESEKDGEVRYVGTDTDGRPYGAPRILKRADFENVFSVEKGAWRLCIIIEGVQGESVGYKQLDSQRQPRGTSKTLATSILVATFAPESAVY